MLIDHNKVFELTKNLNVLYIEDDINFARETTEVLEDFFKSVDCAVDGEEGLQIYKEYYNRNQAFYDIVITDISMPKMDGLALIQNIYTINKDQSIIVVSAHNNSDNLMELVNIGIEQFLLKPLEFEKVLITLYNTASKIINNSKYDINDRKVELGENFYFDRVNSVLYDNTKEVKLTKKELLLMNLFIKNGSKISTFNEIYSVLWPKEPHLATQELLKPIISRFRKKLPQSIIENVYGLGYKLIY